jgi:PHD/YefM family antitoxin component YafN of YafNO toxin-antitoxin module
MGKGKPCPSVLLRRIMRTKTQQQLTVHLDDSDVRVNQVGSLLSITNDNGDTLHIFLSAQGWEQLRQTIHQRTLQAADS